MQPAAAAAAASELRKETLINTIYLLDARADLLLDAARRLQRSDLSWTGLCSAIAPIGDSICSNELGKHRAGTELPVFF